MNPEYLLIPGGYLLGSVSAAIIVCRLMGLPDPRTQGSRNPGATNVARLGGKKAAALTLVGDMLKGLIPVLLAHALDAGAIILAGTALAAFLGHLYPLFFSFQGGKGVATALGVSYGLDWRAGLAISAIWLLMALIFRYSSLAALTAFALAPVVFYRLMPELPVVVTMAVLAILLFWRHRSNIKNLLNGQEGKISFGKHK